MTPFRQAEPPLAKHGVRGEHVCGTGRARQDAVAGLHAAVDDVAVSAPIARYVRDVLTALRFHQLTHFGVTLRCADDLLVAARCVVERGRAPRPCARHSQGRTGVRGRWQGGHVRAPAPARRPRHVGIRALAFLSGMTFVPPSIVAQALECIVGHRLAAVPSTGHALTTPEERRNARGVTPAVIVADALRAIPPPS